MVIWPARPTVETKRCPMHPVLTTGPLVPVDQPMVLSGAARRDRDTIAWQVQTTAPTHERPSARSR